MAVLVAWVLGSASALGAGPSLSAALDAPNLVWQTGGPAPWFGETATAYDGVDAAQSGFITNDQESWLQTTVTGPGSLTFSWRVSSEQGYDQLQFLIDGIEQINISGEVSWQQRDFTLPSGSHVLTWRYVKDASDSAGLDAAWLDQVAYTPPADSAPTILTQPISQTVVAGGSASFSVVASGVPEPRHQWHFNGALLSQATNSTYTITFVTEHHAGNYWVVVSNRVGSVTSAPARLTVTLIGELVEAPELPWTVGGDSSWHGQDVVTHDGVDAAESGAITNSQQSWVQTMVVGPGMLAFWWKVSSEAFYDGLQFLTNGAVAASLSGEAQWEQRIFLLPSGTHSLRWRYFKDGSFTMGQDRGWLDEVTYIQNKPPSGLTLHLSAPVINENGSTTLNGAFVDDGLVDPHLLVIQWGDGSAPTVTNLSAGVLSFSAAHQYLDDTPGGSSSDTNVIRVTVSDEAGSASGNVPLRINNLPPILPSVVMPSQVYPYDTVTVTGPLDDVGSLDTFRLSVNWGDGSIETTNYPVGTGKFVVRHKYGIGNTHLTVTLTLVDDDNGSVTLRTNLSIRPFPDRARIVSIRPSRSGPLILRVQGTAQAVYQVQASEDLRHWFGLALRAVPTNGWFEVEDPDHAAHPKRFYRAIWATQSPGARFAGIWKLSGSRVRLKLVGLPSTSYDLESASNWTAWSRLRTLTTDTNGSVTFDDLAPATPRRFYRAISP